VELERVREDWTGVMQRLRAEHWGPQAQAQQPGKQAQAATAAPAVQVVPVPVEPGNVTAEDMKRVKRVMGIVAGGGRKAALRELRLLRKELGDEKFHRFFPDFADLE
jgi:hypothetical protein